MLITFVHVGEFLLHVVIEEPGRIAKIFRWLLFCWYCCKYFENFPGTAVVQSVGTSWLFTFGAVNITQLKRGYNKNNIRDMDDKEQLRNLQGRALCWQIFLQDPPPCPVCHWTLIWNNLFGFFFLSFYLSNASICDLLIFFISVTIKIIKTKCKGIRFWGCESYDRVPCARNGFENK